MKKIVALVLTLVLALSLATVAFAAPTVEVGNVYTVSGGKVDAAVTAAKLTAKAAKDAKLNAAGDDVEAGNVAYYLDNGNVKWVACDADDDDCTLAVYTASGWVYLEQATNVNYTVKATKLAKNDCVNDGKQLYSYVNLVNGKTYYAQAGAGATYALVDDEIVQLDTIGTKLTATHDWEAATYEKDGITVATYKCADCTVTAKVVTKDVYLAADEALLARGPLNEYLIMSAAAGKTAAATTGVSSAKTFDAGVALYAGMALMSVAGSAVVIGKKKEF